MLPTVGVVVVVSMVVGPCMGDAGAPLVDLGLGHDFHLDEEVLQRVQPTFVVVAPVTVATA